MSHYTYDIHNFGGHVLGNGWVRIPSGLSVFNAWVSNPNAFAVTGHFMLPCGTAWVSVAAHQSAHYACVGAAPAEWRADHSAVHTYDAQGRAAIHDIWVFTKTG